MHTLSIKQAQDWVPLPDWESTYEVHPLGFVRRLGAVAPMGTSSSGAGYREVRLSNGLRRGRKTVHRAVLLTFKGAPPAGHEADHCDQDKTNNCLSNLRWVSHKVNCANRPNATPIQAKLVPAQVKAIRERMAAGEQQVKIALDFGVCNQTITNIKQGVNYAHC